MTMSKRKFGEQIKQYIVEEDTLVKLLELWHRKECGDRDEFEYFWDMMAESGCEQHVTHREFVKAVENMTFDKLAEMDLGLYEEYKPEAKSGSFDSCQDWSGLQTPNN
jgi:hypothetical protein